MPPTLLIRADANPQIGSGHVMRMIALGQAWRRTGGESIFAGVMSPAVANRVGEAGFDFVHLPGTHPDPEDLGTIQQILGTFEDDERTWVAVDGYHFAPEYLEAIVDLGFHLLTVDDRVHHEHYVGDLLLNQNIHAPTLDYPTAGHTEALLGTHYAILREEFLKVDQPTSYESHDPARLLVTLGGSDPDGVTLKVVDALLGELDGDVEAQIIIGGSNPYRKEIEASVAPDDRLETVVDSRDMPSLMRWADVAVCAGGSTCWELCYMGVPLLIIAIADNQIPIGDGLDQEGVARYLGHHETVTPAKIGSVLESLLKDSDRMEAMATKGTKLVDGLGSERVVRCMLGDNLLLRRVTPADSKLLWEWANDPAVRQASFSPSRIPWTEHTKWFESRMADSGCRIYIACTRDGDPVGQIRFEAGESDEVAEVDVSVASGKRGQGFGGKIIQRGVQRLVNTSDYKEVRALVREGNAASQNAFLAAGFSRFGKTTAVEPDAQLFVWRSSENEAT